MSASRSWLELAGVDLLPVVAFGVEYMDIIHPMYAIISTEVDDL